MSVEKRIFWAFAERALMDNDVRGVVLDSINPLRCRVIIETHTLIPENWLARELVIRQQFIDAVRVLSPGDLSIGELDVRSNDL